MGSAMNYLGFISGGLNTAAGLATSLISQSQQRKENDKNRRFNAQQAQLNRDFQSQMFDRSNAWNSPAAQVNRLRSAGLNPALMYQGSSFGQPAVAPSGAQGSSGSSGLPGIQAPNYEGALMQAQIDNIRADTENKKADNGRLLSDSLWADLKNKGEVELNDSTVLVNKQLFENYKDENSNIKQELLNLRTANDKMMAEIDNLKANTSNINEDTISKQIANRYADDTYKAQLDNIRANFRWTLAKTDTEVRSLGLKLLLMRNQAENVAADTAGKNLLNAFQFNENQFAVERHSYFMDRIKLENNRLAFDLESDETWRGTERFLNCFGTVCDCIGTLLGGASSAVSSGLLKSGSKAIGFGR